MSGDYLQALNAARALKSIGNHADSIRAYQKAISYQPDSFEALAELGIVLWEQGQLTESLDSARKLIQLNPCHPQGYMLMGHVAFDYQYFDKSISAYQTAIKLVPNNVGLYNCLALALKEMGRFEEAFDTYNLALSLAPDDAEIHNNRSILSLLIGELRSGFEEYEWRKLKNERYGRRNFDQPEWRGEDLTDKVLLIHHEQGMGDAIQFSRYVKILKHSHVNVIYAAHPPLIRLLSSMEDIVFGDPYNQSFKFDYHCPLLSLPFVLGTTLEAIPADFPYLSAEPERIIKWRNRIGDEGFKIGVAWQGSGGRFATNRLFPPEHFSLIQDLPNVRLIGLHKSPLYAPWQLSEEIRIESMGPDFDSDVDAFLDSAAVIQSMDLVITCDTAIAHLAGAMGKPTWVILRHVPHWVWLIDRSDSPWYPNTRLFRQKKAGDWAGVFSEVRTELSLLVSSQD